MDRLQASAGVKDDVAPPSLRARVDNIGAGARRVAFHSGFGEPDSVRLVVVVDMLEHHDVICASGDRRAGHDFNRLAQRKLGTRSFDRVAGANLSDDGYGLA
jgi:hypothetical protein